MKEMPWRRFVTSGPVWAIVIANFCMDWGGYTLMTNIPTFYKEVLLFDIESVSSVGYDFKSSDFKSFFLNFDFKLFIEH